MQIGTKPDEYAKEYKKEKQNEAQGDRPLVSNGISANNPKKEQYEQARKKEFGE